MPNRGVLSKGLAIAGTVFAWLPILGTVLTGVIGSLMFRRLQVDYLAPAELFPATLVGGLLLLWAAMRAQSQRALVSSTLAASIVLLFGFQAIAEVTGLANGRTDPVGWPLVLTAIGLALFIVSVVSLATGGILLLRELFRRKDKDDPPPS